MNITVVGLGKLGSPMAALFAAKGHSVVGADLNAATVKKLAAGLPPVEEPQLAEHLVEGKANLSATTDVEKAAAAGDIVFVIVPTDSDDEGWFSCQHVVKACEKIGRAIAKAKTHKLVVIVSTVMPGDTERHCLPALEKAAGRKVGDNWGLCYNPEFIALGSVIHDMENPDYVLIGQSDDKAGWLLQQFYATVHKRPVRRMRFCEAELVKLAINTACTAKISYANTLAELCEKFPGCDVDVVTEAVGLDSRIGAKYLRGGLAFGGPCFPRDTRALAALAARVGGQAYQARAADAVNRRQPERIVDRLAEHLGDGAKVSVLGLAYKPDTPVVEESPSLAIIAELLERGYVVTGYDPLAGENARRALPKDVRIVDRMPDAVAGADAVIVAVASPEYGQLLPIFLNGLEPKRERPMVVLDCWRVLRAEDMPEHVTLIAIGRGL